MEPIISPWIIYIFSIIINISFVLKLVATLSLSCICSLFVLLNEEKNDENIFTIINWMKKLFIISVICGILLIFIPDRQTLLTMLTLNSINHDNIQLVQGNIVDFINQIMDSVNK
jgi:hypothetical protein